MNQGLSKREKMLLFSAGILVIVYLAIQFAIIPLSTRYLEGIQERSRVHSERSRVDADISNKASIQREHDDASDRYETIKQQYPLLVPNEEVDTILTNLCIMNGLSPSSLSISRQTEPTRTSSEEGEHETPETLFTMVNAKMNVSGNNDSVMRLIDAVDDIQYIRITNLSYTASRQDDSDIGSVSVEFELTFVNP